MNDSVRDEGVGVAGRAHCSNLILSEQLTKSSWASSVQQPIRAAIMASRAYVSIVSARLVFHPNQSAAMAPLAALAENVCVALCCDVSGVF